MLVIERVPKESGWNFVFKKDSNDKTLCFFDEEFHEDGVEYWLEEIQLPSYDQIESKARDDWYTDFEETLQPFKEGANYILGFIDNKK